MSTNKVNLNFLKTQLETKKAQLQNSHASFLALSLKKIFIIFYFRNPLVLSQLL